MLRHFRNGYCAALVTLCSLAVGAQHKSFTLEQVMSAPFPTDLVAATASGSIAWVFDARGERNIWVASPPGYQGRRVTDYSGDDGQELGELAWTSDSRAIVYTRGGDLENDKEYPNPRSFPQGVEQDVWVVELSGGKARRLGEGHSPAASPRANRVAFVLKDQVWTIELTGKDEKAAQLIHSRGKAGSLRWSPDGAKLAFVSDRGDHSLLGVYDFAAQSLVYLDPSVDRDSDPAWSPDGRSVAFIRVPSSREATIFGPKRSGQPWSIRVADAATGAGHEVWRAAEGRGSVFRGISADNQLFWGAGDRLVFPWESDGWTHVYSEPVSGAAATLLTPGDFEVEWAALGPDRKEVVFNSNQDDIDRRHVWRSAVEGGRLVQVTRGTGIEWSPVVACAGGTIALLHSDATRPGRPAIVTSGGAIQDVAPDAIPTDFPATQLAMPQQVIFSAADGLKIHGQLFAPPPDGVTPVGGELLYPAVVFFHGGSRRQMLLGWHYMGYYSNAYAMNQYLASRGYFVLSVNYRSGIGYGMEFREALNYGATGASEFNDVLGAGLYLRNQPHVDPKRIGLWGGSYGGYLTALGLARASDLFAAGVDMHGVHDWNQEIHNWLPSYDPAAKPDAARLAWESSPLASVATWRSPVLLIQGDDDRNVPFSEMVHLVEALRKQGVKFEQVVFPDEIHDFLTHRRWLEAYHAAADFFDRCLGQH